MKIKWLGHATFLTTADDGTKIINDPYATSNTIKYGEIKESADIVTVSHGHGDHNNIAAVRGNPRVIKEVGSAEVKGIKFKSITSYHDNTAGSQRGANLIFCFEVDGIRVCHLGDLGHQLGDKDISGLGKVDILLTPVGGFYTIDAKVATEVSNRLAPRVIIPMHYKNDKCAAPISGVDDFLQGKKGVKKLDASEAEFKAGKLPTTTQIIVLQPAL
ncbi:MAG: MBL fold metallo-hydrolase [Chloroflexi bacterium]|nr:MBL fold metallo-hydrolase [Chloroflexota bacterium]